MVAGFVLPLYAIMAIESFLAFNLMLPLPLCLPAVRNSTFPPGHASPLLPV